MHGSTKRSVLRRWSPQEAERAASTAVTPELGLRVYSSRLLGSQSQLVLHGGGNTSIKGRCRGFFGEELDVLWVKGSGVDLGTLDETGLTALELRQLLPLLDLADLSDPELARALARSRLDPTSAAPSVETLLHAFLPFRYVDHAHPDAVLAVLATPNSLPTARRLWGAEMLVVPYVKPGFQLARECKRRWERAAAKGKRPRGIILQHHGIVTFSDDPRASYESLVGAVARAEEELGGRATGAKAPRASGGASRSRWSTLDLARLRSAVSAAAGRPFVLRLETGDDAAELANHPNVGQLVRRGPLTPDHTLHTKRIAAVVADPEQTARAVATYCRRYRRTFERYRGERSLTMLDPAPRVLVLPGFGFVAAGPTPQQADIARDVFLHTARAILDAERLGGYRPLGPRQVFEVEYWDLEQAKLRRHCAAGGLAGRVAMVTGAASGIGLASVEALLRRGAAVVGLDLQPTETRPGYLGQRCDVLDGAALREAIEAGVRRFGGIDVVISSVGVFPSSRSIRELEDEEFQRVLAVNVGSHLTLLRELVPYLELSQHGAVVLIGSRNVLAPGPGAGAYSASKAALTQLGRVAALELAPHGIRVNTLHPDGVFDTGLWTKEVLASRAAAYGLDVESYKRRNLLRTVVRARDVGELAAELAGELFAKTTGAQIPVDGGNVRSV